MREKKLKEKYFLQEFIIINIFVFNLINPKCLIQTYRLEIYKGDEFFWEVKLLDEKKLEETSGANWMSYLDMNIQLGAKEKIRIKSVEDDILSDSWHIRVRL